VWLLPTQSDVMCSCLSTSAAAALHAQNLSPLEAAKALLSNPARFTLNLTQARMHLPAGPIQQRAMEVQRNGNVLQAHAGRVPHTHSILDEVTAQMDAFNAAQRLLHPTAVKSAGALSALELEGDISSLLELDAEVTSEGCGDECMGEYAFAATASGLAPRSVDELMLDFQSLFADEIRLSRGAATAATSL
jgi:hypothetical protein